VNDLPKLGGPALRALLHEGIDTLTKLSKRTEKEILGLHGMGPKSMPTLKKALKDKGLSLKEA
jgi:DNA-directed RNA polymerase alpha subunit